MVVGGRSIGVSRLRTRHYTQHLSVEAHVRMKEVLLIPTVMKWNLKL